MKKIIVLLSLMIICFAANAQYTRISQRYSWLAGLFDALGMPSGPGPAAFQYLQAPRAGALYYDSVGVDSGTYVYSGLAWRLIGSGGGTTYYVSLPLYLDGDTIKIDPASAISDGYVEAARFAKWDSLRNNWVRISNYLYPANTTDSIIVGVPTTTLRKWNLTGDMNFQGIMYTASNRRALDINTGLQNALGGGRVGNPSGTENAFWGELAGGSCTTCAQDVFLGKGAGFTATTATGTVLIGRNVHASGGALTANGSLAIMANLPSVSDPNQLNINNWIYGNNGRLGIGSVAAAHIPTASWDIDSVVDYAHIRMREMAANPTVVNDGNFWHYNDHFYARLGGVTYQLDQQSSGALTFEDVLNNGNTTTQPAFFTNANVIFNWNASPVGITFSSGPSSPASASTYLTGSSNRDSTIQFMPAAGSPYFDIDGSLVTTNRHIYLPDESDTVATRTFARSLVAGGGVSLTQYRLAIGNGSNILSTNAAITGSRMLGSDANGVPIALTPTTTEANYVAGATSNIQTQLDTKITATSTTTLTNKRITRRVFTEASNAAPVTDIDNYDMHEITALAANTVIGAPTGTPTNGQGLIMIIKSDATPRTIGFNAVFRAGDITFPTTTIASKKMYLGFIFNDTKWDLVSKIDNF